MKSELDVKKKFSWPIRVYYEDTDSGGRVYYGNYFKFAERARTELLRRAEISQENLRHSLGYQFVVRKCQAEFFLPAHLDDELIVLTDITHIGAASIDFYQEIKRGEAISVHIITQIVCIGRTGRPQRIPQEIRQILFPGS